MKQIHVIAEAILNARPEDVYATIADYHNSHPLILPPKNLYDLQVEQGGYGAGTIIRFKSRAMGIEKSFYQRVKEPDPGRILVEEDIIDPQDSRTTFTVNPIGEGKQSHVIISTTMKAGPGLQGFIERILIPRVLPPIYYQELKLLEEVTRKRSATT